MGDFDYLDECAAIWEALPPKDLTREQQAVLDVCGAIGLIEGDGVEALWSSADDHMDRIIESFRMAGASEIADKLQSTSFCKEIIGRTLPNADDWAYSSPEQQKQLTEVLFFVSSKGPDAREGLLRFLPKRKGQ